MALTIPNSELPFDSIVAGNPISVAIQVYDIEHIFVTYGLSRLAATQGLDFAVELDEDNNYQSCTVTPTATLLLRINELIATTAGEINRIYVTRTLPMTNDFVESDGFIRRKIVNEIDMVLMRIQQFGTEIVNLDAIVDTFTVLIDDLNQNVQDAVDLIASVSVGTATDTFYTLSAAMLATINPALPVIRTLGFATPGDGGGATYKAVGYVPAHAFKFQDAVGKNYEGVRAPINVLALGASTSHTEAENRVFVQQAITACDVLNAGKVIIPYPIDYGWKSNDRTTLPSFAGIVHDMVVLDDGIGSTYDVFGPPLKDGWQSREITYTAQTTPAGQHDGNGNRKYAAWHPYYWIEVSVTHAAVGDPSRTAVDNLRSSFIYGHGGNIVHQIGTGQTKSGLLAEIDEMYDLTHSILSPGFVLRSTPWVVVYRTGAFNIQAGSRQTKASVWIKHEPGVWSYNPALPTVYIENALGDTKVTLGNTLSTLYEASITNHLGVLQFDKRIGIKSYTTAQRLALVGTAEGETVWDSDLKRHCGWSTASSAWFANGVNV